jgi:regulator of replication initiation timing
MNIQNIIDKKTKEIDILRSDIATFIQENNMLKQEKNKAEIIVNIIFLIIIY